MQVQYEQEQECDSEAELREETEYSDEIPYEESAEETVNNDAFGLDNDLSEFLESLGIETDGEGDTGK